MSGIDFYQTRMGQTFYNYQLPHLLKNLEELNKNVVALTEVVKKQNELIETQGKVMEDLKEQLNEKVKGEENYER